MNFASSVNFRSSGKIFDKVVKGFFGDPRHLHNHFIYISGVNDLFLKDNIQKNLLNEFSLIVKYLTKQNKGAQLQQITDYVNTLYDGSFTHKAVVVLRLMADTIDGDGKELFVFEQEQIISTAPVIRVLELPDK